MDASEVSRRIVAAVETLADGLRRRGWRIATPEPFRSGILAAFPPDGDAIRAAKALEARGVIVAPREGAVRFSPHAYNDAVEAERIVRAVEEMERG